MRCRPTNEDGSDAQVARENANQLLDAANTAYYTHAATLSRLEANKEAYEQQVKQLTANQERIQNDIDTLKTLIAKDRDEGVDASHKRALLEPKLQTIEADLTSLEASIASTGKAIERTRFDP